MPTPSLHSLRVPRTARYARLGTPSSASEWWIVLHGYGQLAPDFIEPFASLVTSKRCVIAPEALSRFYTDDITTHQEVGASWMTRIEREAEIRDYVAYLDATVRHLAPEAPPASLHVLGFSQGAATASRWVARGETSLDRLVLWGGGIPPDVDLDTEAESFQSLDPTLVVGTEDLYVSDDDLRALERRLETHGIAHQSVTFDGGHEIVSDVLERIV